MSIAPVGHNMCARSGFPWHPSRRLSAPGNCFSTIAGARTVADDVNKLGRSKMAELTPTRRRIFDAVRAAAVDWQGSDPIRHDWPHG